MREETENNRETQKLASEKINKTDKPLARMTKKKESRQNCQYKEWKRNITIEWMEVKTIKRKYSEQFYAKKLDNLGKVDKSLENTNIL